MTGPARRPGPGPEASLALIRIAMLVGVLTFGGVIWYLHRQPAYAPAPPTEGLQRLTRALDYVMIGVVAALVALRVATGRTRDAARARSLTIIGWAAGELAALAGGVHYFLTNDPRWYGIGVLVLIASYVVLPIRRRSA